MFKATCLLAVVCLTTAEVALEDTELEFTFLVHRHGDRAPVEQSTKFSTDPEELRRLAKPYGFGQLTEKGKLKGYQLGEHIRNRYNGLISPTYNHSEIFIRSTDIPRTEMTILAALAAIYPPGPNSWSQEIHWTPVPYTTLPPLYDFNLYTFNCPEYTNYYKELMSSNPASMSKYQKVLAQISNYLKVNITQTPILAFPVYETFTSQLSLGLNLPAELEAIFPEIEEAAAAALNLMSGNEDYLPFQAGPYLNEFFKYAAKIIAGEDTQRVRIYSAHDQNVFSLVAISQADWTPRVPEYGSAYALELRRVKATGQYIVQPVFLPSPGEEVLYFPVKNCSGLCDYEQFYDITSKFTLDVGTWRKKCGFYDLIMDDANFD